MKRLRAIALTLVLSVLGTANAQVLDRKGYRELQVQNQDHGYITLTWDNSKTCKGEFHDVWADDAVLHKKVAWVLAL